MLYAQNQHEYHEKAWPCNACKVEHYNLFKCVECRLTMCAKCYLNPAKHLIGCINAKEPNFNINQK